MNHFGEKLNPLRRFKTPLGLKGDKIRIVTTNNPSTIDQNQNLRIHFPNLGVNDIIVPGTTRLTFDMTINSTDPEYTIVENIGRALVKKIVVSLESRELYSLDDADILLVYCDLWKSKNEREDAVLQGIDHPRLTKKRLRYPTADGVMVKTFKNKFCIPLDFEVLNSQGPFFQNGLADRLSYDFEFNSYDKVIKSTDLNSSYIISNICLEYDVVNNQEIARILRDQYQSKFVIYYERILRHTKIRKNAKDTRWNLNLNIPSKSLKGILLLFKKVESKYERESEEYFNPMIKKVEVLIEGRPNQLYASGLEPYQHFEQIQGYLGSGHNNIHPMTDMICKQMSNHNVRLTKYLQEHYGLWIDMRSSDDNSVHGNGRRIDNGSEGLTLLLEKEELTDEPIDMFVYVVSDAQVNIEQGRLKEIMF